MKKTMNINFMELAEMLQDSKCQGETLAKYALDNLDIQRFSSWDQENICLRLEELIEELGLTKFSSFDYFGFFEDILEKEAEEAEMEREGRDDVL